MPRLVRAFAAGVFVASSVLIAGPALAAPAPSHWELAAVSELSPPVAGDTVELYADLHSDSSAIVGKSATLLTRTVGSGDPFKPVATVMTDDQGRAAASLKLVRNTAYRWHFAGDSDFAASSTGTLIQQVASKVVAHGTDLTLRPGQALAMFGKSYPGKAYHRVRLWMGEIPRPLVQQPDPVLLTTGRVHADGTFRLTRSFSSTGWKRLYIAIDGDQQNSTGFSNYVVVKVG